MNICIILSKDSRADCGEKYPARHSFGNHDAEAQPKLPFLAKENQICIYAEYENFRSTMNDEDVSGCANCSLPILSSDGKHIAWNIWCIDSGDYVRDDEFNVIDDAGYGFVKKIR